MVAPRHGPRMDLDALDPKYTTILCDVWGVIHDGGHILPGAHARLARWRDEGRKVILVTNAPRPASSVENDLFMLGLERSFWHAVSSSGSAGIAALTDPPRPVGFIGTAGHRAILEAEGVLIIDEGFEEVAVTALDNFDQAPGDFERWLGDWRARGILFHCLNPDRVVVDRGTRVLCPGALADVYEAMGGQVCWYGKPHHAIYAHALALAGSPDRRNVLAIGDGAATDLVGAAREGFDALFVTGGIHAGENLPDSFFAEHGLGDWRPIGSVETLA